MTIVKDKCNRESRVVNLTHHSDPQRDPVLAIVEWLHSREVFINTSEYDQLLIDGQFEIKEDCLDQSLFICLKYNKFHPTLPLNAKLLGEIVTSRAMKFGFKAKSVSGHCLRKGTATQIILNEIIENGVSSDKTYRALEEHIGWVPHTKVTKTYVNDITSRLRDSTKFVSGDKRDSIDIKDVASITFAPTEVVVKQEKRTCNKEYLFRIVKATEGMNKNEERNFIKKDKLRVFKSLPEVT